MYYAFFRYDTPDSDLVKLSLIARVTHNIFMVCGSNNDVMFLADPLKIHIGAGHSFILRARSRSRLWRCLAQTSELATTLQDSRFTAAR